MQIVKTAGFKRCIDGTVLKECTLDGEVTREMVAYLDNFGTTKVLGNLKQPFFSFAKEGLFTIKGMVGDACIYVRFKKEYMEISVDLLYGMIAHYDPDQPGIEAVRVLEQSVLSRIDS